MKNLHNLPFKKKFAIVLIPLIVIILFFDYLEIRYDYLDYYDSKRLNKAINLGIEINHLVHELQKERSITAGFLSNGGGKFVAELTRQRERTDSTLNQFYDELSSSAFNEIASLHTNEIQTLKADLDRVIDLRNQADKLSIDGDQAIRYYSEINSIALSTVSALINETRDKVAAQQVHAIIYFLKSKEDASIERAIGTQIFSSSEMDESLRSEFVGLIASQDSYLDAFLTISNKESFDFYHRTMRGQDIDEVERMRTLIDEDVELNEDPNYWYKVMTSKINSLKRVEEYMLDHMHAYTENIASVAKRNFWAFLIIDFLVGALFIMFVAFIVSKLIKNVGILEKFTMKVSGGDYSNSVVIDTKDEIGQYAKAFNSMVQEINKSHKALQKEKDHAEYLYENIYKQAEVVFENVGQGILLLDKELKISNLYSKAVERIFDNDVIARENFSSFMRPRLIQRDFEALEMFIKHLFNSDLDEEVVNQLNPVESVKIFISTNGVVVTKYLRLSFTRVEREGEIQNILVTITDETESVLLQQHMEESEAKKKQETEYMLDILKVDPTILKDFIENTRRILKGISEKYEKSGKSDLNSLLKYTFQMIHNVKGNAMTIGLELVTQKLHDIEDSISGMMNKNVTSDNFLAILYDIEEVDHIMSEMSKLLVKVADIYRNFPSQGSNAVSSQTLDTILEDGLSLMCKETGKNVELKFNKPDNIEIPDHHMEAVKDMMIQLMRNSISHGIESEKEREDLGKRPVGKIEISFDQTENNELFIYYKDDGQGLDYDKIRDKAIQTGLISEKEASGLKEKELLDLLLRDGFSTTEEADNYSGRGQGLGLVQTLVSEQEGSFEIGSRKGKFFEMKFILPKNGHEKIEKAA